MAVTMRLLVVEDEQRLAQGLRKGLEAEGFAVDVVHSGTDGIWMARENPFDAIVLDIMLPGANGYEVCRTLRGEGNWTPILILTAKDAAADEVEGLDTGADDYLSKPFSHAVLIARLRALLRRGARPRPSVLDIGALRLDPAAHRVWRNGEEIPLTAREFAVLEYFVHHPDEVLSKKDILDHVWDFEFDGAPNIVEVYVRRLRAKLQESADRPVIETIRGAGYRLVVGHA
jgi:two-component system OmpR family response regulator